MNAQPSAGAGMRAGAYARSVKAQARAATGEWGGGALWG